MNRPLRRVAAALFVVAAGLFVVGVNTEGDTHDEPTQAARHRGTAGRSQVTIADPRRCR